MKELFEGSVLPWDLPFQPRFQPAAVPCLSSHSAWPKRPPAKAPRLAFPANRTSRQTRHRFPAPISLAATENPSRDRPCLRVRLKHSQSAPFDVHPGYSQSFPSGWQPSLPDVSPRLFRRKTSGPRRSVSGLQLDREEADTDPQLLVQQLVPWDRFVSWDCLL